MKKENSRQAVMRNIALACLTAIIWGAPACKGEGRSRIAFVSARGGNLDVMLTNSDGAGSGGPGLAWAELRSSFLGQMVKPIFHGERVISRLLTSPPGRGYSSTIDGGASPMPGRGIQRQGREFNMPRKKEMLIL